MTSDNSLGVTNEQVRALGLLAEMRYADIPDGQAINSWDWQSEGRFLIDLHLAEHADAIEQWHAGAEQRRLDAAEKANRELHEARAAREAELEAGLAAHDADGRLL
jgi:hypothetical protein